MNSRFYRTNFRFAAERYEEWQSGRCISRGNLSTEILAEVHNDEIRFKLDDIGDIKILRSFSFEIFSDDYCILPDRIQYSHNTSDFNPIKPIICHIFYEGEHMDYIRFAMTNPDRIVEFYGELVECGQPAKGIPNKEKNNCTIVSADNILNELRKYGMENTDAIMERAVNLYNDNSDCASINQVMAIVESLKLFIETYRYDEDKYSEGGSPLKPKILMFIALCNYKINNIYRAYCIAKQGLKAGDDAIENSVFVGIPRQIYGEDTLKEIVGIIEANYMNEVRNCSNYDIDPTEVDTKQIEKIIGNSTPSKQQIKLLIENISLIQEQFSKAGELMGDTLQSFQINLVFETFKMPLYFAWQGYKYGWHTDFCKEGDSLIPFMMFEADMKNNVNNLITALRQQSPFADIEKNSAITKGLISIYSIFLTDLEKGKFKF